ncbi:MAG: peptide chain release factor 1 [Actinobacteria bacterium]|nr:peptide chain release factor 1 [Actinomycetota bacterium]NBU16445.1 peptide chain release factor 1 [Actinomycetota bacterium]
MRPTGSVPHERCSRCGQGTSPSRRTTSRTARCRRCASSRSDIPRSGRTAEPRPRRSLDRVQDRLDSIERDFLELEASLGTQEVLGDQARLRDASRRYKQLTPLVQCIRELREVSGDAAAARELMGETSGDERDAFRAEAQAAEQRIEELEERLKLLLLPPDENDGKNVIMEIRGAEGGEEANLFARDLMEMYLAFAARRGWSVETIQVDDSDMGGINQATLLFKGEDAWTRLKFEGGPHRVQRVPATESQGRVHTSSATVMVMPEAEEVDVEINDNDLEIDVYRASGAGGQHVNTTDSAVRITHKPTGVVVAMQDERSQLQNRARAMQVLRSRLLKLHQDEQEAKMSAERRSQIGGGGRGEKIRTYNYKENRITDHRIGFTLYQLQAALAGDLDPVVDALAADLRARQLADGG